MAKPWMPKPMRLESSPTVKAMVDLLTWIKYVKASKDILKLFRTRATMSPRVRLGIALKTVITKAATKELTKVDAVFTRQELGSLYELVELDIPDEYLATVHALLCYRERQMLAKFVNKSFTMADAEIDNVIRILDFTEDDDGESCE